MAIERFALVPFFCSLTCGERERESEKTFFFKKKAFLLVFHLGNMKNINLGLP